MSVLPEVGSHVRVPWGRGGGTYDYYGVNPGLFEQMLLPNPWRRVGRLVKARTYAKVA